MQCSAYFAFPEALLGILTLPGGVIQLALSQSRLTGHPPETEAEWEKGFCPLSIWPSNRLVLDVTLPGLNGLELQKLIARDRIDMPIIFITGYGAVRLTVHAMKAGAIEFLTKPFGDDVLLSAIRHAIERSHTALAHEADLNGDSGGGEQDSGVIVKSVPSQGITCQPGDVHTEIEGGPFAFPPATSRIRRWAIAIA